MQSLSLSAGLITLDLEKQKLFNQGQINAASNRVTDINNLHIFGIYNRNDFRVNKDVTSEYNRLRDSSCFMPLDIVNISTCCFCLTV